ncbi:glycogen debranching protein GlgX [Jannaschia sp. M317]|uniref:glycogen debranching protein GlgX n=1 Tax=Jannaschia sp. M317 TaxID=2867011 RepID=UPI0021A88464|nr:glycogen debranching protein GlgX [Jannaschia sp. M317]UWQ19485.1 glycogen debranching protein GlgX [Jannaschia sp. M317]
MGVTHDGEGANFAVYSEHATQVSLCLFSPDGQQEVARLPLPERTGPIWHGYVAGLPYGTLYGYRVDGPYQPERGHRFNANKLLIDPYAREFHGRFAHASETYGFDRMDPSVDLSFDARDSAPFVPKSVISRPDLFEPALSPLAGVPASELIYEAHAKGLTMLHPDVAEHLRGTYEGLASDSVIEHLHRIGATTIELLPVQAFPDDGFLIEKGLRNYWGYNTIGFFAPEPRYFGPAGFAGFRAMVQRFHDAGIRVLMDVVYNHTAEGDQTGPTLAFRGLDNASYYRLIDGQKRYYVNDAGTGNTLNMTNPHVLRMVLDSLRFWVTQMGIDGFRFDLATTLGRESYGFDPHGGFLDALRQDPILSQVRLIAEPWDLGPGGYQLGNFPYEFSEWNDGFRDTARRFWKGDDHATQELGGKLLGSADKFDCNGRRTWASINFLTSHDGFTLADVTAYNEKHNAANLEDNRDGHSGNYSDNCGVEGATDDPVILAKRALRARNLLATMFLSQGTPMLLAGDEVGNSQGGNNNAYCQDSDIGWIDWSGDDALTAFVARLSAFRRDHATVRQSRFLHGRQREADGMPDVIWRDFAGQPLEWRDPALARFCLVKRPSAETTVNESETDVVLIAFNRADRPARVSLPPAPEGTVWTRHIDTTAPDALVAEEPDQRSAPIPAASVIALSLEPSRTET